MVTFYSSTNYTLIAWCVRWSDPARYICVVCYLVTLLFWVPVHQHIIKIYYHPFYPDVAHMRICTRLSPLFRTTSNEKLGRGLETRLYLHSSNYLSK